MDAQVIVRSAVRDSVFPGLFRRAHPHPRPARVADRSDRPIAESSSAWPFCHGRRRSNGAAEAEEDSAVGRLEGPALAWRTAIALEKTSVV